MLQNNSTNKIKYAKKYYFKYYINEQKVGANMFLKSAKKKQIGFPRALSYYNYFPYFWGFFNKLGIEIILSAPTTKKTLAQGSALVVTETCLPIKVYVGHVVELVNKGIEKIFVPSIQSIAPKIYNCSKIRGLPDLIRNVVKGDFEIIEATLDKSEDIGLLNFLGQIARQFGIKSEKLIKEANKCGFAVYNNFKLMMQQGLDFESALKNAKEGKVIIKENIEDQAPIHVALVGHGYNIYDKKASMDIYKKLHNLGVKVYDANQLTDEMLRCGINTLDSSEYWANQLEVTGCAGHYLNSDKIDGIITVTAFGCGPDSLMLEDIKRKARNFNKPLLHLTIDEHTGEAGFVTRLEAFCDMLFRNKRRNLTKTLEKTVQNNERTVEKINEVLALKK